MNVLGLDIGGANIKAASNVGQAISRPFAIWRDPGRLQDEISSILVQFPQSSKVAVTMTAELADCFATKAEGVQFILEAVEKSVSGSDVKWHDLRDPRGRMPTNQVLVWTTDGEFIDCHTARNLTARVAAANWHALATWCGSYAPEGVGLLVDIGTTTTDIIPIRHGKPVSQHLNDVGRLQSGELSYSGVRRTPLCAVAHSVPLRDGYCPLAAEVFATTLDIHLLLDEIAEDERDLDTANGKPATKAAAHDRIARMLCCDRVEISFDDAVQIARFLADVQRQRLAGSLERVIRRLPSRCETVIVSGSGSFLARRLIAENRGTENATVISLADLLSPAVAEAACAYAVAQLAALIN